MKKRMISLALAACMLITILPISMLVAGAQENVGGTLCLCDPQVEEGGVHTNPNCPYYDAAASSAAASDSAASAPAESEAASSEAASAASSAAASSAAAEEQPTCICTEKCTQADAENGIDAKINADCPVCGAEGADLSLCTGKVPAAMLAALSETTAAATIGDVPYDTLQEAIDAVADGQVITLQNDLTENVETAEASTVSFTLDLNGKTLSATTGNLIHYQSTGTLTIQDSAEGGGGTVNATAYGVDNAILDGSGTICVVSGTVSAKDGNAISGGDGSTIIVSGGTVSAENGTAISSGKSSAITVSGGTVGPSNNTGGGIYSGSSSTITVSGGTVSGAGVYGCAIFSGENSMITISGGALNASGECGSTICSGNRSTIDVSGGTVNVSGDKGNAIYVIDGCTVNVTGGTVSTSQSGNFAIWSRSSWITVSGGIVSSTNGIAVGFDANTGGSTITVTGGTVRTEAASASAIWAVSSNGPITVTASGGTIEAPNGTAVTGSTVTIPALSSAVIKGGTQATSYWITVDKNTTVTASENYDGSNSVAYHAADYAKYKYLACAARVADGTQADPHKPTTWAALQELLSNTNNTGTGTADSPIYIQLTQNLAAAAADMALSVPQNSYFSLDLNGKTLDRNLQGSATGGVILVQGNLTLRDSSTESTGTITGGKTPYGGGVYVSSNANFTMLGGKITGNTATSTWLASYMGGGGVYVAVNGAFRMEGGEISGNTANQSITGSAKYLGGGGVYVAGGSFEMAGGKITGNTAASTQDGGGVYVGGCSDYLGAGASGTFTMTGGEITGNTAGGNGGGVYVAYGDRYSGSFTMTGGEITGNTAGGNGGGVYVAYGYPYSGSFTMAGGKVTSNTAGGNGGGVYSDGTVTLGGTASITGNTAGAAGSLTANNIYLPWKTGVVGDHLVTLNISDSPLATGAKFGVTSVAAPTDIAPVDITASGDTDVSAYFVSDNDSYCIQNSADNVVQLALVAAQTPTGTVWNGTSAKYFDGGTGSPEDPYQIRTAEQLCLLSAVINQMDYSAATPKAYAGSNGLANDARVVIAGGTAQTYHQLQWAYYKLTADIRLNDTTGWQSWSTAAPAHTWYPIGRSDTSMEGIFYGHFDGNGKTISGLYFSDKTQSKWNGTSGGEEVGLFGMTVQCTISKVTVAQSYIHGNDVVGGVIGYSGNSTNLTNCKNSGTVFAEQGYVGGLVGRNDAADGYPVSGCENTGTVSGMFRVGGIVGSNEGSSQVENCKNTGAVSGLDQDIGGVVGYNGNNGTVTGCTSPAGLIKNAIADIGTQDTGYRGYIIGENQGTDSSNNSDMGVTVAPASIIVAPGGTQAFTAKINQAATTAVTWSIVNQDDNISIGADGTVTVGSAVTAGTSYTVKAVSTADTTKYGMAMIVVGMPDPAAPSILTASLPGGVVGTAYSQALAATGYPTAMTWSVAGGSLPAGLALSEAGVISGTPTASGTDTFTVTAANGVNPAATKQLAITIASPITSITVSPDTATVQKTKTQQFTATITAAEGTDPSVTWSVSGGTKSSIDANGRLTVGAIEAANTLTVRATAKADSSKFATATVTVAAAPKICTVTFDSAGGTAVSPITGISEGNTITLPNAPTKENCRFDGWFTEPTGGTQFVFGTLVTESITLYAHWTNAVIVAGKVTDSDGKALPGISVSMNPANGIATTDADGKFAFAAIPQGAFTVTADFGDGLSTTVNVVSDDAADYGKVKIIKPAPYLTVTTQPQDATIVKGTAGSSATFHISAVRTPNLADSVAYEWYWLKGETPAGTAPDEQITGSDSSLTLSADNNSGLQRGTYKLYGLARVSAENNGGVALETCSRVAMLTVVGTNTIAGVVQDSTGAAVSGATVELVYAGGAWPYAGVAMTSSLNAQTTAQDGAYCFMTVPDGKYTLKITLPSGGSVICGPYNFPGSNPPVNPDDPINPGVVIPSAASIQINTQPQDATVKTNTPVTLKAAAAATNGAALSYQWYQSAVNSNAGGSLIGGAKAALYKAQTTGKGTNYYYCVVSGAGLTATTRAAKVTAYAYETLTGTVKDKAGKAVAGAEVLLVRMDQDDQNGITTSTNPQTTGTDGKYQFADVPDGTYQLKVTLPNGGGSFVQQPITMPSVIRDIPLQEPAQPTISFTRQPESLTVALHDTAELTVSAGVSDNGNILYQWYQNASASTQDGTLISGATGKTYRAPTTAKGITYYYCVAQATGAQPVASGIAKVIVRNTPVNNIMTLTGTVKDADGNLVQGASVTLSPAAGTSQNPQTTGADGTYTFANLPDGKYTLIVALPDGGTVKKDIKIEDGEITPKKQDDPSAPDTDITAPDANTITITQQPQSIAATTQMTSVTLTVQAAATKSDVSYQWYKNERNTTSGGTRLTGTSTLTLATVTQGTTYYYCVVSASGAADVTSDVATLTVTKATETGGLGGGVTEDDNGDPVEGATVKLMKGGTNGTQFGPAIITGKDGAFSYNAIPYGSYSLVAQKNNQTVTRQITIQSATTTQNLSLPSGTKNTMVVIKENTPSAAVENLETLFTETDNTLARQPGASVEIQLVIEKQNDPSDKNTVDEAVPDGQQAGMYFGMSLVKTIRDSMTSDGAEYIQPSAGQALHIVMDIPAELQGKENYGVIRSHTENGLTDVSTVKSTYNSTLQTLSFDADALSTYAIVYKKASYNVTVVGSEAGSNSGAGQYEEGSLVTIQAGSRSGYTFAGWTSADGVAFTDASAATTTFTMLSKAVSVTANWQENGGAGASASPTPAATAAPGATAAPATTAAPGATAVPGATAAPGVTVKPGDGKIVIGTTPTETPMAGTPTDDDQLRQQIADALQQLADAKEQAIAALPSTLTDAERQAALNQIEQVYTQAAESIQAATSGDDVQSALDQNVQSLNLAAKNAAQNAGNSTKKAGSTTGTQLAFFWLLLLLVLFWILRRAGKRKNK